MLTKDEKRSCDHESVHGRKYEMWRRGMDSSPNGNGVLPDEFSLLCQKFKLWNELYLVIFIFLLKNLLHVLSLPQIFGVTFYTTSCLLLQVQFVFLLKNIAWCHVCGNFPHVCYPLCHVCSIHDPYITFTSCMVGKKIRIEWIFLFDIMYITLFYVLIVLRKKMIVKISRGGTLFNFFFLTSCMLHTWLHITHTRLFKTHTWLCVQHVQKKQDKNIVSVQSFSISMSTQKTSFPSTALPQLCDKTPIWHRCRKRWWVLCSHYFYMSHKEV